MFNFGIRIGQEYRYDQDFGGKFWDGSSIQPIKYVPTKIENGRVFYDVISPQVGFLYGSSASKLTFWICYTLYA